MPKSPPANEAQLLARCQAIEGLSFAQLASKVNISMELEPNARKGWLGLAVERALGAAGGNFAVPDFQDLGIELKTLPISHQGKPTESTFITSIPLLTLHQQNWETSSCYAKLKRILWITIEGDKTIPYAHRRIGRGFLWSPTQEQKAVLQADWEYLTEQIVTGNLEGLDARAGEYLQVRPKAAHGKSLCFAFDSLGNKVKTLPRGFYLRTSFTQMIRA